MHSKPYITQYCSTMDNTNHHLPILQAYCCCGGKTLPLPNPHLSASSIKSFARKTGDETMVSNARWMVALRSAKLPVSATIPYPIHLLTCCHLSLSTCGGRNMQTCSLGPFSQWDSKAGQ